MDRIMAITGVEATVPDIVGPLVAPTLLSSLLRSRLSLPSFSSILSPNDIGCEEVFSHLPYGKRLVNSTRPESCDDLNCARPELRNENCAKIYSIYDSVSCTYEHISTLYRAM
jgi:hypothetical protein